MSIEVGSVYEGTVTSIAKFGAFVSLPERKSGLVHISEIAASYVADVNDFLQVGQSVKVRVLAVTPEGKINLSIKRAEEQTQQAPERRAPRAPRPAAPRAQTGAPASGMVHGPTNDASFEDRLKHFMQEADSRIAGNRLYSDRNRGRRRGK